MNKNESAAIEIGVIIAGPLEDVDRIAVGNAIEDILLRLEDRLTRFDWRFSTVRRDEWTSSRVVEPTDLVGQAREERDERGWDFAFVITASDLVSHYKPSALAVICSSLDVAIVSTSRIDPRSTNPQTGDDERANQIQARVLRLMLHSLGHWLGLVHHDQPVNAMYNVTSIEQLSAGVELTTEQADRMTEALVVIADQRLEERSDIHRTSLSTFYLLAAWENRDEILDAVRQARPWEFPTRLSRLTTAAVSTVMVLLMTAETWDMAMSQSWVAVIVLFIFSIVSTTGYVAVRQQLLLRRNGKRITEQIVTSNVSASAIVASGMLVVFLLSSGLTLLAAFLLFPSEVVSGWAASIESPIELRHYLLLAATVGSLGILIGALGASFEQQHHFRHVVFVDEEV